MSACLCLFVCVNVCVCVHLAYIDAKTCAWGLWGGIRVFEKKIFKV